MIVEDGAAMGGHAPMLLLAAADSMPALFVLLASNARKMPAIAPDLPRLDPPAGPPRSSSAPLLGLVVVVVAGLAVGGVFYARHLQGKKPGPQSRGDVPAP